MRVPLAALLACPLTLAQEPVTSVPEASGRSKEIGGYSISNSVEVGYRFASANGDLDIYRAGPNYGNGLRLFEGRLRVHSLDGKGRLADEFSVRSFGAARDPYQAHVIRIEKNGLYRYDGQYRLVRYHNRLGSLWGGERGLRTSRSFQNHDFVFHPGSRFEVMFGYDRNRRTGPGFSSAAVRDEFGGYSPNHILRYQRDFSQAGSQYRFGFDARFAGLALTARQALDRYEEGGDATTAEWLFPDGGTSQSAESFALSDPLRRRTPITTIALRTRSERRFGFNARYVYAGGSGDATLRENISTLDPAASLAMHRETLVIGDANRKQSSGDLTLVLLPALRWTVTNTTAFHNTRIDGQASFLEIGLYRNEYLRFNHLGVRRLSNATEANFRPIKPVSLYGAFRVSARRVWAEDALRFPNFEFANALTATGNEVRSGSGGFRWVPSAALRASIDFEVGMADRPLTPTSERRFHNESARLRWRHDDLVVSGFVMNRVNDNPTELLAHSSKSRSQGMHASWARPQSGVVLDAGYSLLQLDVSTGILNLFDLGGDEPERSRSLYASRIHNVNFALRLSPAERVTIHVGLAMTRDLGKKDFDASLAGASRFTREDAIVVSSLPMSYFSPQTRLSVSLKANLSWNLGWQHFSYSERLAGVQGYRAHMAFSSLTIGF